MTLPDLHSVVMNQKKKENRTFAFFHVIFYPAVPLHLIKKKKRGEKEKEKNKDKHREADVVVLSEKPPHI